MLRIDLDVIVRLARTSGINWVLASAFHEARAGRVISAGQFLRESSVLL